MTDQPELFDVGPRSPAPPSPGRFGKSSRFGKDTPCVPAAIGSGPAGETFDHFAQQEHGPWQPLTIMATRGCLVSCDQCDGEGWFMDPVTYRVQQCKHCNSTGSTWDRSGEVQIGGRWFMRQRADLLLLLPRVEYRMPVEKLYDGRPLHFRSGGAEGLLMPLMEKPCHA